jgi:glycosyltransferase involved in cell wall biosynthesis
VTSQHAISDTADLHAAPGAPALGDARPRLWFVSPSLGRSSEPWLLRQIRCLRAFETAALCWSRQGDGPVGDNLAAMHVAPFDIERAGRLRRWSRYFRGLRDGNFYACDPGERRWMLDLSRADRPDVMLCHFGYVSLRMLPVAQRLGVPLVAHFHGLDVSSLLRERWYRWSLRRHLDAFAAIIVVGSRQREWMLAHGADPARVHLIPCGVPTEEFTHIGDRPDAPIRFLTVCRLVAWKGVDVAIRAFAPVAAELPEAVLTVVGEGPETNKLRALAAELGVAERVEFRGAQPPAAVRDAMAQSHVFVQHSLEMNGWYEGFGVSLAEAAAMGLPIVASRTGGIMDQVVEGETGFLVGLGDGAAMGEAMLRLGRDAQQRARMGDAGRRRMLTEFDTPAQVAKLEGVLLDAVRSGARG